jgi:zinc protease
MLAKKTRGNTVLLRMSLRFGDETSLMNKSMAASLAGQMLMRGTTKHTRQQVQDELDKLKARAFVGGSVSGASVSIETVRDNLPAVLSLVAEILREPAFPAPEFEQLTRQQIASAELQLKEPQVIAFSAFGRHMSAYPKGDPRYVESIEERISDLKSATLDEAKKFYSDFYGASNAEVAVVGDFDDKAVEKLVADLFGSWKSPAPYSRLVSVYKEIPPLNRSFETPDKANAVFVAGLRLNLRDDDPDYPALILGNYILGGGILNSRLSTRIRQKEGLSYSVGSSLNAGSLDRNGGFTANAISAPQNAAKVETAFKEEIAHALKDGFTEEEVATAKSGYLQSRQLSRSQDQELASRLLSNLYVNRTFAWDADFEKKVAAVTPDQILEAMRRYIDPSKLTIVKAGDFAKAAPQ